MKTLAIETSCDDTSLAIVSCTDGFFVIEKMLSYTQTEEHRQRGGVVPELAARSHAEKILVVLAELGGEQIRDQIDFITVTSHPGLPGALIVGITTAYTLSALRDKPVVEVNHIMGHVFSILVGRSLQILRLPYLCLTVSGGHNDLYLVNSGTGIVESDTRKLQQDIQTNSKGIVKKYHHLSVGESLQVGRYTVTKLGQTVDDAAGEAFDKVARMLGGPYPGGKRIGEQAEKYDAKSPDAYLFHPGRITDQPLNFSFSGIKSQAHNFIEKTEKNGSLDETARSALAFAFQECVTTDLVEKLALAAQLSDAQTIGIVGGVSANTRLREQVLAHELLSTQSCFFPEQFVYCTDNAAMIGVVGLLEKMN